MPDPFAFDPSRLTFSEDGHRYLWDGVPVPFSVTGVIKANGLYAGMQYMTQAGRDRGSAVHSAIEIALRYGDLDETSDWARECPDELARVKHVLDFIAQTGFRPIPELIEAPLYSPFGFCGKLDLGAERGKERAVIDWKSGAVQGATRLQLAAYASCLTNPRTWRRIPVQAFETRAKANEYPQAAYQRDLSDFLAALRVCQLRAEFGTNN